MKTIEEKLKSVIRDVPDFPKPGIIFKDITPILMQPEISRQILSHLETEYKDQNIDAIAGIESRGFLFGFPLALRLGLPFILVRKEGKLPYKKISHGYQLEYGTSTIEMHEDAVEKGQKVLIHDDLLATGGSADAAAHLVQKCGGTIVGFNFLVELSFLKGRKKLENISRNCSSLTTY